MRVDIKIRLKAIFNIQHLSGAGNKKHRRTGVFEYRKVKER